MISSQDGTEDRRDRPPAAFLAGRSRGTGAACAVSASASAARGCAGAGLRTFSGGGPGSCSGWAVAPSLLPRLELCRWHLMLRRRRRFGRFGLLFGWLRLGCGAIRF